MTILTTLLVLAVVIAIPIILAHVLLDDVDKYTDRD
jgi:hypothetical protein